MRSIVNISMPAELVEELDRAVLMGDFMSRSELIRNLVREWKKRKLIADVRASQKEIAAGKGKVLRSLRDLRS